MRAIGYEIVLHLREHKRMYLITVFLLVMGLSCGSATAVRLPAETSLGWGPALGGTLSSDQGGALWRALWREARFFGLIALCGVGIAGVPAAALLVAVRGFIVGFTTGFLFANFGSQGIWVFFVAVAPQNLILLPSALVAASSAMRAPLSKQWGKKYWFVLLGAMVAALIGSVAEALLSGLLPKMI